MKIRLVLFSVFVLLMGLAQSGCGLSHEGIIHITDPSNGNTFPLGQTITLRVHVNTAVISNYNHISDWQYYEFNIIDGDTVISHGARSTNFDEFEFPLTAASAGAHYVSIQGRVARPDPDFASLPNNPYKVYSDWINSNEVCFYVGPNAPSDFCSTRTIAQPLVVTTSTSTPFPTATPTPIPVIDSVQAYPNPIYYGQTCPSISTVTFRAALTLPNGITPDLVDVQAHVRVIIGPSETNSGNLMVPLRSNGTWDSSSGGQVFLGTVALTHSYNDALNHFDLASLGGGSGALLWYVDASEHDPSYQTQTLLGTSSNQVLSLAPCPTGGQNPTHNSNNGNSNSGSTSGCGQYTNQTSCNLAGCSWNPQNSSCSVNP